MPYTPTYTYDAENRVKAVNGVTYTYDGDGNRVLKSSGTLYWGWGSGNGPLAESDLSASSTSWKEYVFFNGQRVARRDASNSTVHYFFSNYVGSTRTGGPGFCTQELNKIQTGGAPCLAGFETRVSTLSGRVGHISGRKYKRLAPIGR